MRKYITLLLVGIITFSASITSYAGGTADLAGIADVQKLCNGEFKGNVMDCITSNGNTVMSWLDRGIKDSFNRYSDLKYTYHTNNLNFVRDNEVALSSHFVDILSAYGQKDYMFNGKTLKDIQKQINTSNSKIKELSTTKIKKASVEHCNKQYNQEIAINKAYEELQTNISKTSLVTIMAKFLDAYFEDGNYITKYNTYIDQKNIYGCDKFLYGGSKNPNINGLTYLVTDFNKIQNSLNVYKKEILANKKAMDSYKKNDDKKKKLTTAYNDSLGNYNGTISYYTRYYLQMRERERY